MSQRIFSTLTLWTLVFCTVYFLGTPGCIAIVAIITLLTQNELNQLLARITTRPFGKTALAIGLLLTLSPLAALAPQQYQPLAALLTPPNLLALALVITAIRILPERTPETRIETLAATLFSIALIPLPFHYLTKILLIQTPHNATGIAIVLWLIAAAKLCDTGALLTGLAIGKNKMCPGISPKKTWEGAAGGIATSCAVSAAIAAIWPQYFPANFTPAIAALIALPIAVLAIISDLIESAIKRRANIKDSGKTIPGIGGIFDLTDSFLLTAPVACIIFEYLLKIN